MIVLGLAWYIQARDGNMRVIGVLGSEGANATMLGQQATVQLLGVTNETLRILITDIIHYDTIKDYIAGEGYSNIAPQTDCERNCEADLLKIYDGRKRIFNPMNVAACGGINAWRFELVSNT